MTRIIPTLLLTVGGLLTAGAVAEACSCRQAGAPCQEYWTADVVFVGQVTSSERTARVPAQFGSGRRVSFAVASAFRGLSGDTAAVETGLGGGDCGYPFTVGERYVVYASRRPDGTLTTGVCTRTAPLSKAADDVAYATALANGTAPAGGVSGLLRFSPRTLAGGARGSKPMPGMPVIVSGEGGSRRVVTDEQGRFAVSGLAAGTYAVTFDLPPAYYALAWDASIELADPRACAEVVADVLHDGRVSGQVVDAAGAPVPGLTLEVVPPTRLAMPAGTYRTLTDRNGRFEIVRLPPGRFVVALNPAGTSRSTPEPSVYMPGVTDPARAKTGTLPPGGRVDAGLFTLPASVVYVPVEGTVLGPDGTPAADAKVYLKLAGEQGFLISEPAVTGADGRFVLAALSGGEYEVVVDQVREENGRRRVLDARAGAFIAAAGMPPLTLQLRPPR